MSKIHAAVTAVHGYVPDYILTNQELETMVDTNDEWITTRTGIKERRILKGEGKATSDMAVPAVNGLLEKRGIGAEEIDLIIFRSEEHTSELQSLMRISYAVLCLKKKNKTSQ